ncbi:mucin-5AC-like [Branchiostoma floridae]|uniref:Mucin-5AC-like n=2 Tax=Branchiostoma floridae TaxID=7739 RepID=A0A9J7MQK7_BRAFL|nr:mucin-5AC-like [Branchiostoma floridae]
MILPSDVARLVLGYLSDEGLVRSRQVFLEESPHLSEIRQTAAQGQQVYIQPVLGKDLKGILEEYAAIRTQDELQQGNNVLGLLWKKLDTIVSQIRHYKGPHAAIAGQASGFHGSSHPKQSSSQSHRTFNLMTNMRRNHLQRGHVQATPAAAVVIAPATSAPHPAPVTTVVVNRDGQQQLVTSAPGPGQGHAVSVQTASCTVPAPATTPVPDTTPAPVTTPLPITTPAPVTTPVKNFLQNQEGSEKDFSHARSPKRKRAAPKRLTAVPELQKPVEYLLNSDDLLAKLAHTIGRVHFGQDGEEQDQRQETRKTDSLSVPTTPSAPPGPPDPEVAPLPLPAGEISNILDEFSDLFDMLGNIETPVSGSKGTQERRPDRSNTATPISLTDALDWSDIGMPEDQLPSSSAEASTDTHSTRGLGNSSTPQNICTTTSSAVLVNSTAPMTTTAAHMPGSVVIQPTTGPVSCTPAVVNSTTTGVQNIQPQPAQMSSTVPVLLQAQPLATVAPPQIIAVPRGMAVIQQNSTSLPSSVVSSNSSMACISLVGGTVGLPVLQLSSSQQGVSTTRSNVIFNTNTQTVPTAQSNRQSRLNVVPKPVPGKKPLPKTTISSTLPKPSPAKYATKQLTVREQDAKPLQGIVLPSPGRQTSPGMSSSQASLSGRVKTAHVRILDFGGSDETVADSSSSSFSQQAPGNLGRVHWLKQASQPQRPKQAKSSVTGRRKLRNPAQTVPQAPKQTAIGAVDVVEKQLVFVQPQTSGSNSQSAVNQPLVNKATSYKSGQGQGLVSSVEVVNRKVPVLSEKRSVSRAECVVENLDIAASVEISQSRGAHGRSRVQETDEAFIPAACSPPKDDRTAGVQLQRSMGTRSPQAREGAKDRNRKQKENVQKESKVVSRQKYRKDTYSKAEVFEGVNPDSPSTSRTLAAETLVSLATAITLHSGTADDALDDHDNGKATASGEQRIGNSTAVDTLHTGTAGNTTGTDTGISAKKSHTGAESSSTDRNKHVIATSGSVEKETRTEMLKPKQQHQKRDVIASNAKSQEVPENRLAVDNSLVSQEKSNTAGLQRSQLHGVLRTAGVDRTVGNAPANSAEKFSSVKETAASAVTGNQDAVIREQPKAGSDDGRTYTGVGDRGVFRTEMNKNSEKSEKTQKQRPTGKHVTFLEERNAGKGAAGDLEPESVRSEAQNDIAQDEVPSLIASQKVPSPVNEFSKTLSQQSGKRKAEKAEGRPQDVPVTKQQEVTPGRVTLQSRENNSENSTMERRGVFDERVEEGNERADGKRDVSRSNPVIVEIRGEKRGRSDSDTKPGKKPKTNKQRSKGSKHGKLKFPANLDVDSFLSKIHNGS